MRRFLFFSVFTFFLNYSFAQVGIGTVLPDASSVLDISASDKGILIPQVSLSDVSDTMIDGVNSAATGLLIYNTNASVTGGSGVGFYYFNGTNWDRLVTTSTAVEDIDWYEEGSSNAPNDINDNMYTQGNIAVGTTTATYRVDINENNNNTSRTINISSVNGQSTNSFSIYNQSTSTGTGARSGLYNLMGGNGNGFVYGVQNNMQNNGSGLHAGVNNVMAGLGSGAQYGTFSNLSGTGAGLQRGTYNSITNSGNALHYGTYNVLSGSGMGTHYGVYNALNGNGTGVQRASYNTIGNTGDAVHVGTYNTLTGAGSGIKYGTFNMMPNGAGGTHYGVYSSATKAGSLAGYFEGDVQITGAIINPSDRELKENITETKDILGRLNEIQVNDYQFKKQEANMYGFPKETQTGFIAQQLESVFPDLVHTVNLLEPPADNMEPFETRRIKSVNYLGMVPILTKAVQEQQQLIEDQAQEIEALKNEIKLIKEMLSKK